jgi:hypothetical protein
MEQKRTRPAEWNRRKTRHDPPALGEAIAAAQGLTDQVDSQIEIAAQLIGLPEDEVRQAVVQAASRSRRSEVSTTSTRHSMARPVVVERRAPRMRLR